jgi:hypothetical protein
MASPALSQLVADLTARRRITEEDVTALRRLVFGEVHVTPGEAEVLIALDETVDHAPLAWSQLFVEALTDFLVHQEEPRGYVSEANADWLRQRIARDGAVKTHSELELLVNVLEKAKSVPMSLVVFALEQVKHAVLTGKGPLACGGALSPGVVTAPEVDLLRRILYAAGGDGHVAITRREAEVLFDINDATVDAANDAAWDELFVKALANFLLAASGYQVPTRAEALRREQWLDSPQTGVMGFFRRMVASPNEILGAYSRPRVEETWAEQNRLNTEAARMAENVTEHEAAWLAERLGRGDRTSANERALLAFLKEEASSLHPLLRPLIEKAA